MGRAPKRRKVGSIGAVTGYAREGMKVFDPKTPIESIRPDWEAQSTPMCVHLTGAIQDYDPMTGKDIDKVRLPFRTGAGSDGINNFYMKMPIVSVGSSDGIMYQFILCELPDDGYWRNNSGDSTIYGQIVNECVRAYKKRMSPDTDSFRAKVGKSVFDPADWAAILPIKNDLGYKKRLFSGCGASQLMGIFPCVTLVSNGWLRTNEEGLPTGCSDGDMQQMLITSSSATAAIEKEIFRPAEGYEEQTADPASWFHGDPTNPDGSGKWLTVYNAQKASSYSTALGRKISIDLDTEGGIAEGGGKSKKKGEKDIAQRYSAEFLTQFVGPAEKNEGHARYTVAKQLNDATAAAIVRNYHEVNSTLYIPDEEEQCWWIYHALSQAKRGMELLRYGARDIPHFWTSEIKAHIASRKNIPMSGEVQDEGLELPFEEGEEVDASEAASDIEALLEAGAEAEDADVEPAEEQESGLSNAGLDLDDPDVFDDDEDVVEDLAKLANKKSAKKKVNKKPVKKKSGLTKKKSGPVSKKPTKKKVVKKKVVKKKKKKST